MAPYGGYYCTHMRDEGDGLLEAIDEAIYIAKTGGVPLHISHLKNKGGKNLGNAKKAFEKSFRKFGWATYFIRIGDKLNRLEALTLNNQVNMVKDENIEDTLTDIIGYSLLLLEILRREGEENNND